MSSAQQFPRSNQSWWLALGLRGPSGRRLSATERVLSEYRPVGFVATAGDPDVVLSCEQLVALAEAAEHEDAMQQLQALRERRSVEDALFEAAWEMPSAGEGVEQGAWVGFTWGEATAWCYNLFQFEPHGFVYPGSQVRAEALAALRAGQLPEVFGYPQRARQLVAAGMTPREYRQHRVALGANTFDPADVRFHTSAS